MSFYCINIIYDGIQDIFYFMNILENTGNTAWPEGCQLQYVSGDRFPGTANSIEVPALNPGCQAEGNYIFYHYDEDPFHTLYNKPNLGSYGPDKMPRY